jgi:hypothetical protein
MGVWPYAWYIDRGRWFVTLPAHIKAAITRFDGAAQALAFKGTALPEDHHAIIHQHETSRAALERAIEKAIAK